MSDVNLVNITGILTMEPKFMQREEDGVTQSMAVLTVAIQSRMYTPEDGMPRDFVCYTDVNTFGPAAEFANAHMHKGDRIFVAGKLRTSRWNTPAGRRSKLVVVADIIHALPKEVLAKKEKTE